MSTQPDLFTAPKRVQDTSIEVYRAIAPELPARERRVRDALSQCSEPTAYELFRYMRGIGEANDLNDVRPRLTELEQRGIVEKCGKRECGITGRTAYTWRVKE